MTNPANRELLVRARNVLAKAGDFIQPFNRAEELLNEIDEALAAITASLKDKTMQSDGWLAHRGREMPVRGDSRPGVRFADGTERQPGIFRADRWERQGTSLWQHNRCNDPLSRIVAYKPENTDG